MELLLFIFATIFSIMLLIFAAFMLMYFLLPIFGYSPSVGSSQDSVKEMVKLAGIKKGDKVIDLGCGDGRILFEAMKHTEHVTGIEINAFLVYFIRIKKLFNKRAKTLRIWRGNFFDIELNEYDIVFCYLGKKTISKVAAKVKKEMRPGSILITNTFSPPNWIPEKISGQRKKFRV